MQANQVHCLRLNPKQDLKIALLEFCREKKIQAACILSAVGSIEKANLRLADSQSFFMKEQKFEIVSITGTLSVHGCHVHVSISDSEGQVTGGHLLDENLIYTTCELAILEIVGHEFKREHDPQTGFNELKIYLINS